MIKNRKTIFRFHFDDTLVDVDIVAPNFREAVKIFNQEHTEYNSAYEILQQDESGTWVSLGV
jgi:hypothetical protein